MKYQIATITLNPAYDLVGFCSCIELGLVNTVNTLSFNPAGKGINIAKVLCALKNPHFDINITVGGFLGQQNQQGFNQLFTTLNLIDKFHIISGQTRINVKLTEQNNQVTDLNFSGFVVSKSDWQQFSDSTLNWLKNVDMVAIAGSLPNGIELPRLTNWLKSVKKVCPKMIFDSSQAAFDAGLKAKPWLIKPNQYELESWAGCSLSNLQEIKKAAVELNKQGIENVVVSLGEQGALWVTEKMCLFAQPPKCDVVSTVGAGDSMVAGLIYGLTHHYSMAKSLKFASAVATLSVSQAEVGLSDYNLLNQMLEKTILKNI